MCRWFAYISKDEECLLEDCLIIPDHALSKQVDDHFLPGLWPWETASKEDDTEEALKNVYDRNFSNNDEGLGAAWYSTTRSSFTDPQNMIPLPTLYKTTSHPMNDSNFLSFCSTTATKTLFAHIRAASAAMPVNEANCHPFNFGRMTFMHNGVMGDFHAIKKGLIMRMSEDAYSRVMGTTDSEHIAGLLFTILAELSSSDGGPSGTDAWLALHPISRLVDAMNALLEELMSLQKTYVTDKGSKPNSSSLNLCLTDGEQLVAVRYLSHKTQQPPSLYWTTEAGVVLNRKFSSTQSNGRGGTTGQNAQEHGEHLIVASEPNTHEDAARWHLIEKNTFVIKGKDEEMRLQPVSFDWQKALGT